MPGHPLIWRQALIAVLVGAVFWVADGPRSAVGYAIAFYAISTPLAIWADRRRRG